LFRSYRHGSGVPLQPQGESRSPPYFCCGGGGGGVFGGAFGGSFGAGFDGEGGGSLFEDGSVRKPSGTFAEVDGRLSGTSWRAVEVFGFGAGGLAFAGAGVGAAGASTTVLAGVSPGGSSGRDAAAGAVGTIG